MSDRELEVGSFFGIVQPVGKKIKDPFELFEWIMESYKDTLREKLALCDGHPNLSELEREVPALCESWTTASSTIGKPNLGHRRNLKKLGS